MAETKRQHEALRVPQGWEGQAKALIMQLERILTQLYQITEKTDNDLKETNENVVSLIDNFGIPTSNLHGYLRRKTVTYTNKTVPSDGYLQIDSYTGLELSNSDYIVSMNIRGWVGFANKVAYTIVKGSDGTKIYIVGTPGSISSITVEYFVWSGYVNTSI